MSRPAEDNPSTIVVIGGSLGAVDALREIVPCLPAGTSAAIFVVVHVPSDADSFLPRVLTRNTDLAVDQAQDGERIAPGHIYVAAPNHHLTMNAKHVRVRKGPRENRHRPAIDPLFRTAARAFGPAVIAVVLSGMLDDGSSGMLVVRKRGGLGIVQDPADARSREMPLNALRWSGFCPARPGNRFKTHRTCPRSRSCHDRARTGKECSQARPGSQGTRNRV